VLVEYAGHQEPETPDALFEIFVLTWSMEAVVKETKFFFITSIKLHFLKRNKLLLI